MSFLRKGDVNVAIAAQDKTATAFKSAESRMKKFSGRARSLTSALGGVLGARMLQRQVMGAIEYGSALTDAATATRTNIEQLQILKAAARDAGADQEKMTAVLAKVHKAGVDAANGLSTYTRAFDALNIDVDEFNRLPTEKKLEAITMGMKNAEDSQAAYAAAMDILGTRNAPKLMEVLDRIAKDGYGSLEQQIRKTNNIMTETDAKQLDAAADAIAKMQDNFTKFTGDKVAFWLQFFAAMRDGKENVQGISREVETLVDLIGRIKDPPKWFKFMLRAGANMNPIGALANAHFVSKKIKGRFSGSDKSAEDPIAAAASRVRGADFSKYSAFDAAGGDLYGLLDSGWVKVSEDQLATLQRIKELDEQKNQVLNQTAANAEKALSQNKFGRL